jgi:hypothetical protein|nr:MAG TPA: hypothetical protein [Caudoviricetes sp.]
MKINKEIVDFYIEIMNGAATENQLNLMLAMDIKELAKDMKHRVTAEQMERIEKIINDLMETVAIDTIKQLFELSRNK